jgi:hypothetical protein
MQTKAKGKQKQTLVYKPFLSGNWGSALAVKRGFKLLAYQLVFVFVYLFIGQALLFDQPLLRVMINLMIVLGFGGLLYNDGAKQGLDDVTYAEIALQRQQSGKPIDKLERDRCFHPAKGFFSVFAGTLPLILFCVVFALAAKVQVYRLGGLPDWVQSYERRADVGLALRYYHQGNAFGLLDGMRVAVRLLIFPYINMAGTGSNLALLWLERLSPLLVCIIPIGYALGYLQGKRLRAGVHGAIVSDRARRVRKERRERKRRQRQEPNSLV